MNYLLDTNVISELAAKYPAAGAQRTHPAGDRWVDRGAGIGRKFYIGDLQYG